MTQESNIDGHVLGDGIGRLPLGPAYELVGEDELRWAMARLALPSPRFQRAGGRRGSGRDVRGDRQNRPPRRS
jgi:hypothetical protein